MVTKSTTRNKDTGKEKSSTKPHIAIQHFSQDIPYCDILHTIFGRRRRVMVGSVGACERKNGTRIADGSLDWGGVMPV